MKFHHFLILGLSICTLPLQSREIPQKISDIMQQPRYKHSFWGLHVKDAATGEVLYDLNGHKMFLPASTTKLFSVAALFDAYGTDFRFKTPLYAVGDLSNGRFSGQLILVGQGDLVLGGRELEKDRIDFTNRDHINANSVPGTILTKADPLNGLKSLAQQIKQKGINEISGDIQIDDRLFETTTKRGMILSPVMLNENLIDIVLKPMGDGQPAAMTWSPQVEGFTVKSEVLTGSKLDVEITSDESGHHIVVKGIIPHDKGEIIRVFPVKDPKQMVRLALIQEIRKLGIKFDLSKGPKITTYPTEPIALLTSAPLSEYGKLILKVSHNLGADLVPLLLAVKNKQRTFDEGMLLLGKYVMEKAKVPPDSFVFIDAAGGDDNRVTPYAEVGLLDSQMKNKAFFDALPILGVDGSLAEFARKSEAVGKVHAKTGTGISFNLARGQMFSTTHTLAGYIQGKNGQTWQMMVGVNNCESPTIESIFPIMEDMAQVAAILYEES